MKKLWVVMTALSLVIPPCCWALLEREQEPLPREFAESVVSASTAPAAETSAGQLLQLGKDLINQKQYLEAIDALDKALEKEPALEEARHYKRIAQKELLNTGKKLKKELEETELKRTKEKTDQEGKKLEQRKKKEKLREREEAEERTREKARQRERKRWESEKRKEAARGGTKKSQAKPNQAEPLYAQAKDFIREKRFEEAKTKLEEVIRLDPAHPWAVLLLDRVKERIEKEAKRREIAQLLTHTEESKTEEVKKTLAQSEGAGEQETEKTSGGSVPSIESSETEKAEKAPVDKKEEKKPVEKKEKGQRHTVTKKQVSKIEEAPKKIEEEPRPDVSYLLQRAKGAYRAGNLEEAIATYETILRLRPDLAEAGKGIERSQAAKIAAKKKKEAVQIALEPVAQPAQVKKPEEKPEQKEEGMKEIRKTSGTVEEKLSTPVSVYFREVTLLEILNYLGLVADINIIPSQKVLQNERKITIRLKEMPLENALRYVLRGQNLTYRIEDQAIWVADRTESD